MPVKGKDSRVATGNPASASRSTTDETAFSPRRAFVVQFRSGSGQLEGRAEHMASGDAIFFEDHHELLQFFKRVLAASDRKRHERD
jgi:hypothetical protein